MTMKCEFIIPKSSTRRVNKLKPWELEVPEYVEVQHEIKKEEGVQFLLTGCGQGVDNFLLRKMSVCVRL